MGCQAIGEDTFVNIYIGNLAYGVAEHDLEREFAAFGRVKSAQVIRDNESGRSRGFAFVEMEDAGEAARAIEQLNGTDIMGRAIVVNEAKPKERRDGGGRDSGGFRGDRGPRRDFNDRGDRGFRPNGGRNSR